LPPEARSELPGTPDVILPKYDSVVFVRGCYWHRHDCRKGRSVPTKNRDSWFKKFERNVERDAENERALHDQGWQVLVVWSCELKDDPDAVLERLDRALQAQIET
jgi:DNA mismatch endonuclease (patch repair protein)